MTNVSITKDEYQVTVTEGVTQTVTVKAPGPQGPALPDGNKGDITVSSNGTSISINSDVVTYDKIQDLTTANRVLGGSAAGTLGEVQVTDAMVASAADISGSKLLDDSVPLTKLGSGALPSDITIATENIPDFTIVNADVSASAAIAGSKITPDFGSQSIISTGNISGAIVTGTSFSGDGASITNINAGNISTGQINSARVPTLNQNTTGSAAKLTTPRTIAGVSFDGSANISLSVSGITNDTGFVTATIIDSLDASKLTSGTIPDARFPTALPAIDGSSITTINASNISSGTIDAARVPTLNQNTTGSAATLTTARSIGGTSFDGSADIDISYANLTNKLSVGDGGLTQNNFTNTLKSKLDGIETGATADQTASEIVSLIASQTIAPSALSDGVTATTQSAGDNSTKVATTAYTDTAISNLVDSAPSTLDTLKELSDALGSDANFSTTVTNSIATKMPLSGGEFTGNITFSGTQTVDGRDLSVDGTKLDGIESNATADQTASEIKTLLQSDKLTVNEIADGQINSAKIVDGSIVNVDINASAGISISKLGVLSANTLVGRRVSNGTPQELTASQIRTILNVEDGATGDQTASEIIALVADQTIAPSTIDMEDNEKILLGTSDDLQLYHDGSHSRIEDSGTGHLIIQTSELDLMNPAGNEDMIKATQNGATELYFDNSKKLQTNSNGVHFSSAHTFMDDNFRARFGAEDDLQIYHDGANTFLDNNTGDFFIRNNSNAIKIRPKNDEESIVAHENGAVILNFDNSTKLETTSTGAKVTGLLDVINNGNVNTKVECTATGSGANAGLNLKSADGGDYFLQTGNAVSGGLRIFDATASATRMTIDTSGNVSVGGTSPSTQSAKFQTRGTSQNATRINMHHEGNSSASISANGGLVFASDTSNGTTERMVIDTSGNLNIASGNLSLVDDKFIKLGAGDDLKLTHTGSRSEIHNITGDLLIRADSLKINNAGNSEEMARFTANGAAELYFDNEKKLHTTAGGVVVTGDFATTGSGGTITANENIKISNDTGKLLLGSSNDLQIYHNGSSSFIDNSTGVTFIRGGNVKFRKLSDNEEILTLNPNDSVELYFDNSKKLETTSTGVSFNDGNITNVGTIALDSIKGDADDNTNITFATNDVITFKCGSTSPALTVNTTQVKVEDNQKFVAGTGNDLQIFHNGANSKIVDSNANAFQIQSDDTRLQSINGESYLIGVSNGSVKLYFDNSTKLETTSTGATVTGAITGTADATINSINIGKGANSVAGNTVLGEGALDAAVTGSANTAVGFEALTSNTSGIRNTAVGRKSLRSVTTGQQNTAVGQSALSNNTASNNTAVGHDALIANTTGTKNVAVGANALDANTTANDNTAVGYNSLGVNTTGTGNTAVGREALRDNTTASNNTAFGLVSLQSNSTGANNTALGSNTLQDNTTASNNTAVGKSALTANTTGTRNTAVGSLALDANTTGNDVTAIGYLALSANTANSNVGVGSSALGVNTSGTSNVSVGTGSLASNTTANNNTALGNNALNQNTTGTNNTAVGSGSMNANTTGNSNAALGLQSLSSNTTGGDNAGFGYLSLRDNTTGTNNTACGANALRANTTGGANTAVGKGALLANTTGGDNTSMGKDSLENNTTGSRLVAVGQNCLFSNTTASDNTAVGNSALFATTTGTQNVAVGANALDANTTASNNTAIGHNALTANTTGTRVVAVGMNALASNTTANDNVAIGNNVLDANTTGARNIGVGYNVLGANTTANDNTGLGHKALEANTTGTNNVAVGVNALDGNTTGDHNTALGAFALGDQTTGDSNTAVGRQALKFNTTASNNTAVGHHSLQINTTGISNTSLGYNSGLSVTTGDNNLLLGVNAGHADSPSGSISTGDNNICLGDNNITNAFIKVAFTVTSDQRDKIEDGIVCHGLDFVNQLKPKSFWFRKNRDSDEKHGDKRYGFYAQDILALEGPDSVIIDSKDSNNLKFKGDQLIPVLVNAIKELSAKVAALEAG